MFFAIQRVSSILLLVAGIFMTSEAWSAQAGRVQFVHGNVQLVDAAGAIHAIHKGDAVNEGDTLVSGETASAQILMLDGGFIAIRPDTRLKFDSFKFSGKPDKPENSFFSLLKGGFRAITGLIGRIRHQDYRITTPAATIGIRGTDHETVLVLPDDPLVRAGQARPGVYNKVNVGETSITTNKGTVNVLPNQMGYAGGLNQLPRLEPINTNLFTVVPPPTPQAKTETGKNGSDTGERATAVVDNTATASSGSDTSGSSSSSSDSTTTTVLSTTTPTTQVISPVQALSSSSTALPTTGVGGVGLFYLDSANNVWTTGGGGTLQTTASASGGLGAFSITFGNCIANCAYTVNSFTGGSLGTATLLDQGSSAAAGNIHWGRWFGSGATVTGLPTGSTFLNSNLIYIVGDVPTMPVSGTATYAPVGGTAPVNSAGTTGTFLGANVSVDFANQGISVNNMKVSFGGDTLTMSGSGQFLSSGEIPSVPMRGTCSGTCSASGTTLTGDYAGGFTGTNAAGLALGYHISSTTSPSAAPTFEIMGTQAFVRQ